MLGVGEHVHGSETGEAIAGIDELMKVALLRCGVAADINDTSRRKAYGGV